MPIVVIGADLCPIEGNKPYFLAGDAESLFHDLLPVFSAADWVLANLECPLIEQASPVAKTGPTFGEPTGCLEGIRKAGIHALCLANNHAFDHGAEGLRCTLRACERAGLATVGAGENRAAARRILMRDLGGVRVGILAMAEREFSIGTATTPGANPLDVIDFVRNVRESRASYDYLIVLVHGGDEFHVPSPRIQETCRFLVEMGANAVIVQHPHCLGGWEEYRGGHIVYGQGALVMDEGLYRRRASFHEGFLVRLRIEAAGGGAARSSMDVVPFTQSTPVPGARRLTGADEQAFHRRMAEQSKAILDPAWVENEWVKFCERNRHGYVSGLLGYGRVLRRLNATGLLARALAGRRLGLGVRNLVCCETHREVLETLLTRRLW